MIDEIDRRQRNQVFKRVAPFFGTIQPAIFLKHADRFGHRLHPLIEGIYKPQWSTHALSIASMLSSPYSDHIMHLPDRSWTMAYSPKAGGMDISSNRALVNCLQDREPLLVFRQVSDKASVGGSTYLVAGLGLILDFESSRQIFRIRGMHVEEVASLLYQEEELSDDLVETALRLESLEKWTALVQDDRAIYRVSRQRRDAAFREIVLSNYRFTCSVTGQRFVYGPHVEAEAAHIIGKEVKGTDDPRNGLALSRTAHWAFDRGIFTITTEYEVLVHPKVNEADHRLFPICEADRKQILLPKETFYRPHPEALEWHRKERFGAFLGF